MHPSSYRSSSMPFPLLRCRCSCCVVLFRFREGWRSCRSWREQHYSRTACCTAVHSAIRTRSLRSNFPREPWPNCVLPHRLNSKHRCSAVVFCCSLRRRFGRTRRSRRKWVRCLRFPQSTRPCWGTSSALPSACQTCCSTGAKCFS